MKKVNLWESEYTKVIYEFDAKTDVVPQFGGWNLIGTILKEDSEPLTTYHNREEMEKRLHWND